MYHLDKIDNNLLVKYKTLHKDIKTACEYHFGNALMSRVFDVIPYLEFFKIERHVLIDIHLRHEMREYSKIKEDKIMSNVNLDLLSEPKLYNIIDTEYNEKEGSRCLFKEIVTKIIFPIQDEWRTSENNTFRLHVSDVSSITVISVYTEL